MKSRISGALSLTGPRLDNTKSWRQAIAFYLAVSSLGSIAYTQATPEARENASVRFAQDVAPILRDRCVSCHGPTMQQAGLRLDSRFEMLRGGKSGPALTENNDVDSLLIRRIAGRGTSQSRR